MSKSKHPMIPDQIVHFYRELVEVHKKYIQEGKVAKLTEEQKSSSLSQKVPLLNFVDLKIEPEKAEQALGEVCQVIVKHRPPMQDEVDRIRKALKKKDIVLLLEKFIWQDENYLKAHLGKGQLDFELAAFILFNVAKPFVIQYARMLEGQYDPGLWQERHCPVCGWKPVYAVTKGREEGQAMVLRCSLCETQWPFATLKCPHCLNDDHEKLGYFSVEDDEVYRVNVCEQCKGYIKTVDEEKLVAADSTLLTDIKTLHLDMLAEREGYTKNVDPGSKNNIVQ